MRILEYSLKLGILKLYDYLIEDFKDGFLIVSDITAKNCKIFMKSPNFKAIEDILNSSKIKGWFVNSSENVFIDSDEKKIYIKLPVTKHLLIVNGIDFDVEELMVASNYIDLIIKAFMADQTFEIYRKRLNLTTKLSQKLLKVSSLKEALEIIGKTLRDIFGNVTVSIVILNKEWYIFSNYHINLILPVVDKIKESFLEFANYYGIDDSFKDIETNIVAGSLEEIPVLDSSFIFPLKTKEVIGIFGVFGIEEDFSFIFPLLVNLLSSVIEKALLFDKLYDLSHKDPLTGLYNRMVMQERLEQEVARAKRHILPLSFVMVDLDHFKSINDTYGHQKGDEVLKRVAKILKENSRISDVVARYGGEEIAVIMPQTEKGSIVWAEKVRKLIKEELKDVNGSASFGVAIAHFGFGDFESKDLIKAADECLYESKEKGRDRVTYKFLGKDEGSK